MATSASTRRGERTTRSTTSVSAPRRVTNTALSIAEALWAAAMVGRRAATAPAVSQRAFRAESMCNLVSDGSR
jgi:hypothetical protein